MRILFFIILFSCFKLSAQDTIRLTHKEYTSVFSKKLRYPILVEWWVTKQKVNCSQPLHRNDNFELDPLLPKETDLANDYKKSGYDRGHMSPAADNLCGGESVMNECFYFSNMAPQTHTLNAGDWKTLETDTRELAIKSDSIKVWCGSVGVAKKIKSVSVPTKCWKVIYIKKTNEWKSYIFNNDNSKPNGIKDNEVNIQDVENLTKIKFVVSNK